MTSPVVFSGRSVSRPRERRAFALSMAASALSFAFYALLAVRIGVGAESDAVFSAIVVPQVVNSILYVPFDAFVITHILEARESGRDAVTVLCAAYLAISLIALIPYYAFGDALTGRLFGQAYWDHRALWTFDYRVAGIIVPLSGCLSILQVYAGLIGRLQSPKIALIIGRAVALLMLTASSMVPSRVAPMALVAAHAVAIILLTASLRKDFLPVHCLGKGVRRVLLDWMHVGKWGLVLKTDALVDRVLAAHVASGFLSVFNLAWTAMMNVVDSFNSSFVVVDATSMFGLRRSLDDATPSRSFKIAFRHSTRTARQLLLLATVCGVTILTSVMLLPSAAARLGRLSVADLALILVTTVVASAVFFAWKQYASAYAVLGRSVDLAKYLTITFVLVAVPRWLLARNAGAIGFCLGTLFYYGLQVFWLSKKLDERPRVALVSVADSTVLVTK